LQEDSPKTGHSRTSPVSVASSPAVHRSKIVEEAVEQLFKEQAGKTAQKA